MAKCKTVVYPLLMHWRLSKSYSKSLICCLKSIIIMFYSLCSSLHWSRTVASSCRSTLVTTMEWKQSRMGVGARSLFGSLKIGTSKNKPWNVLWKPWKKNHGNPRVQRIRKQNSRIINRVWIMIMIWIMIIDYKSPSMPWLHARLVSPVHMHWRYHSLALSHPIYISTPHVLKFCIIKWNKHAFHWQAPYMTSTDMALKGENWSLV